MGRELHDFRGYSRSDIPRSAASGNVVPIHIGQARRRRSAGRQGYLPLAMLGGALVLVGAFASAYLALPAAWLPTREPAMAHADEPGLLKASGFVSARFGLCREAGGDCIIDGDTFRLDGEKVRIADIDAPETHPPRCAREARLGEAATRALQAELNAGRFRIEPIAGRERDRYGRRLRLVTRDGASLGGNLVDQGLARWYGRGRRPWC